MITNRQFANLYVWAVRAAVFAVPALSLWISGSMLYPYISGRNFGFRLLVELAAALWLGLVFLNKEYRPKFTPLAVAVAVFAIVVGLADFLGVDPYSSFWSRYERMEGYLTIVHLAAYFFVASSVLKTKKEWLALLGVFSAVGVLVGFYGLLQKAGYFAAIQGGFRIDGTIGNPTYLAAYLLLATGACLVLLFNAKNVWLKWACAAVAAFNLLIIYFTATRGVILAMLAVAPLALAAYVFFGKSGNERERFYKKIAAGVLALIILTPVLFYFAKDSAFVRGNPVLARFATMSLEEKTTRSRLMIWTMAWEGFKERPVLGWGQENFTYVFAKHYDPKLYDQEPWFDRSHDIVFDWLIAAGALGLLAYLSLFAAAFAALWSAFRAGAAGLAEAGAIFAVLCAYFIQNLFVFDNFNTYILFFSFLAYLNNLKRFPAPPAEEKIGFPEQAKRRFNSLVVFAAALSLAVVAAYFANIRPMMESRALIAVLQDLNRKASAGEVMASFKKALAYGTFGDGETREQFGRLAVNLAEMKGKKEQKADFINGAIEEFEKQVGQFPDDLRTRVFLGTLYNKAAAAFGDLSYADKGREHIDAALRLSPTRQAIYFISADNHSLKSDSAAALADLKKAVALEPDFAEAQANLASMAIAAGDEKTADKAAADLLKLKNAPVFDVFAVKTADAYIKAGKLSRALVLYEAAVAANPGVAQYYANLAGLY
ncbi:MAG: O-antigen ligase family protein, partial [Parcubacteria group bacterium]|nr:O-antigen ligase family protein [Parcubacteria group bacterium]